MFAQSGRVTPDPGRRCTQAHRWTQLPQRTLARVHHVDPTARRFQMRVMQQVIEFHHRHDGNIVSCEKLQPLGRGFSVQVLLYKSVKGIDVGQSLLLGRKTRVSLKQICFTNDL